MEKTGTQSDSLIKKALESFKNNDYNLTVSYLNQLDELPEKYYNLIGMSYYKLGRFREAVTYFLKELEHDKKNTYLLNKIGAAYHEIGNFNEAERYYKETLIKDPERGIFNFNLGLLYQQFERFELSEELLIKAAELEPENTEYLFQLAVTFHKKNNIEKAMETYYRVISLNPEYTNVYYNLSLLYQTLEKPEEAFRYQMKALSVSEIEPHFHSNLGNIYYSMNKFNEAIKHHLRAIELFSNNHLYYYNLGLAYQNSGEYEKALDCFQIAVKKDPKNAKYRYSLAFMLLFFGEYRSGWKNFEWRLGLKEQNPRFIKEKNYREIPVSNAKRVFVYAEQGFGDTFMFLRYLSLLKAEGKYIIFECQKGLKGLLKNNQAIDEIYDLSENTVSFADFDVSIPLLSLPAILNNSRIPLSVPYISTEKTLSEKWKKVIDNKAGLKVGISWEPSVKSKTHWKRACPLEYFMELAEIEGVSLFSLKKGDTKQKAEKSHYKLTDFSEQIQDFSDTAAIIDNLDLVITVDTSIAHLAGSMGKKTFVLLPFSPDWRWSPVNQHTWYPEVNLFRQKETGNWRTVFDEIRKKLLLMIL